MERRLNNKNNTPPSPLMVISRKKLQSILRCAMVMIQKTVSKSKLAAAGLDLHLIIKRGKDYLTTHHRHITTPTCRPHDPDTSFLSPISCGTGHVDVRLSYVSPRRDYQFSCCSNSPSSSSAAAARRRRRPRNPYHYNNTLARRPQPHQYNYYNNYYHVAAAGHDDVADSCDTSTVGGRSEVASSSGGGGSWSPLVRQVRITDSPFSSLRGDVDCHVDGEAERFIQRFYTDLRLQKWMAAEKQQQQAYFAARSGCHAHNNNNNNAAVY